MSTLAQLILGPCVSGWVVGVWAGFSIVTFPQSKFTLSSKISECAIGFDRVDTSSAEIVDMHCSEANLSSGLSSVVLGGFLLVGASLSLVCYYCSGLSELAATSMGG